MPRRRILAPPGSDPVQHGPNRLTPSACSTCLALVFHDRRSFPRKADVHPAPHAGSPGWFYLHEPLPRLHRIGRGAPPCLSKRSAFRSSLAEQPCHRTARRSLLGPLWSGLLDLATPTSLRLLPSRAHASELSCPLRRALPALRLTLPAARRPLPSFVPPPFRTGQPGSSAQGERTPLSPPKG